ncbi:MAG: hypothetical protein DELT_00890 [Desulfovibrio sp.]
MRTLPVFYCSLAWILAAFLLVGLAATHAGASRSVEGIVPQAASAMGRQMDRQIAARLMQAETPALGVSLAITVPVDVNDLDASNPLARQMAEELTRWFVQAGYHVQEIRKGRMVLVEPGNGEKLLTRRENLLAKREVTSAAILTGTYSVTSKNVRFNIRILHTATQDVLGMATVSVPITSEVKSLLGNGTASHGRTLAGIGPSVGTTLP